MRTSGDTGHSKYGIISKSNRRCNAMSHKYGRAGTGGSAYVSGIYYVSYETRLAVCNNLSPQYLLSTSPSHCHTIVIGTSYAFLNIYCFVL